MKNILSTFVVVIVLMVMSAYCGWRVATESQHTRHVTDTVRVEVTDTIPYYEPVAKDSVVVRYVTKVLKVAEPAADTTDVVDTSLYGIYAQNCAENMRDSVAVEIPITQNEYIADEYHAYVSGYMPRLDSIFVYQKTVTEKVVVTQQHTKQARLSVGVVTGIGYGVITNRPDAFVGVGLSYRIW